MAKKGTPHLSRDERKDEIIKGMLDGRRKTMAAIARQQGLVPSSHITGLLWELEEEGRLQHVYKRELPKLDVVRYWSIPVPF